MEKDPESRADGGGSLRVNLAEQEGGDVDGRAQRRYVLRLRGDCSPLLGAMYVVE